MNKGFSTRAIHAGQEPEPITGAVNVPVFQTSTYAQRGIGEHTGFEYARTQNPTRFALEDCIAELEGAPSNAGRLGVAFSSGLAAIDAVMRLLSPGDHVIAGEDMYGGTYRLFMRILDPLGYRFTFVDLRDVDAVRAAATDRTRMIYAETPTNPMMRLCDLDAMASIANEAGAMLVVDNTFMSPYLQNPIAHGAAIVLHSSTKYIGGHSDLVGGLVVARDAGIADRLRFIQNAAGAIPGPWDCFLALRSLKTLAVRMDRHCDNAMRVAEHLKALGEFTSVIYPGLDDHPQHELASRQMRAFGGMISADIGSLERARHFCSRVRLFTFAESLGGVESLLCHPVSMTHGSVPPETRARLGITDGLLRFSVGIENVEDLIQDIEQALREDS